MRVSTSCCISTSTASTLKEKLLFLSSVFLRSRKYYTKLNKLGIISKFELLPFLWKSANGRSMPLVSKQNRDVITRSIVLWDSRCSEDSVNNTTWTHESVGENQCRKFLQWFIRTSLRLLYFNEHWFQGGFKTVDILSGVSAQKIKQTLRTEVPYQNKCWCNEMRLSSCRLIEGIWSEPFGLLLDGRIEPLTVSIFSKILNEVR